MIQKTARIFTPQRSAKAKTAQNSKLSGGLVGFHNVRNKVVAGMSGCGAIVRTVPDGTPMKTSAVIEIQGSGRQEHIDGGHDVVCLGRHRMGAAFGIELQVD